MPQSLEHKPPLTQTRLEPLDVQYKKYLNPQQSALRLRPHPTPTVNFAASKGNILCLIPSSPTTDTKQM